MAIKDDFTPEVFLKNFPETIPEITDSIIIQIFLRNFTGLSKANNEKDIFSSSTSPRFMACPMNERFDRCAFTNIQNSYTLWGIYFMASHGQ